MMVVDRGRRSWEHRSVADLPSLARAGDVWVFNDSRVLPARLIAEDGVVELLLVEETGPGHWVCLATPAKRTRAGARFTFARRDGGGTVGAEVLKTLERGERVVRFHGAFEPEAFGLTPLPPYILARRKLEAGGDADGAARERPGDRERYQTAYAREAGSVAAPTAGLHFTPEMMAALPAAFVTLHVGPGTFRPVKTADVEGHVMQSERYWLPEETARRARAASRRVAVGTTAARVLESVNELRGHGGRTTLFVRPPHRFRHVDALVTNFHLPRSTLLMLVAAFLENGGGAARPGDGLAFLKEAYAEAVRERYRFYSFGDAMLVV